MAYIILKQKYKDRNGRKNTHLKKARGSPTRTLLDEINSRLVTQKGMKLVAVKTVQDIDEILKNKWNELKFFSLTLHWIKSTSDCLGLPGG